MFVKMESDSISSLKTNKTDEEEVREATTIRFVNLIFLPFQPIFKFCILITAITKCVFVSSLTLIITSRILYCTYS